MSCRYFQPLLCITHYSCSVSNHYYVKHYIIIIIINLNLRKILVKTETFAYILAGIRVALWGSFSYNGTLGYLPITSFLPSFQSHSSFDSPCVPPPSPRSSCTQYLHISHWGAVSLVAVVVALEYSCLASLHNWEIREPSTVSLNGKISPHRLLYCLYFLLLSFNPLSLPALLIFPLLFPPTCLFLFLPLFPSAILCLSSCSSSPVLSISLNPLLTFIPHPTPSFLLSSSRVLVLNTPEPGHGSLGVPGLLI